MQQPNCLVACIHPLNRWRGTCADACCSPVPAPEMPRRIGSAAEMRCESETQRSIRSRNVPLRGGLHLAAAEALTQLPCPRIQPSIDEARAGYESNRESRSRQGKRQTANSQQQTVNRSFQFPNPNPAARSTRQADGGACLRAVRASPPLPFSAPPRTRIAELGGGGGSCLILRGFGFGSNSIDS